MRGLVFALKNVLKLGAPVWGAQRRTMRLLSVAEKNDAAKSIAQHLSKGTSRRREGFSQFNKIYEFEANVFGQKCTMTMTSVSGHLLTYEFVGAYKVWQSCSPLSLFEAPVVKTCPEDYQKIRRTLEREIKNCQGLIIWTDCDREGENIGYEIIQVCSEVKPNLQIYRAKFSEITAASVNRALQNLGAPNKNISDAVDVRQELDLRIGAAFTRFQTLRLQKVFPTQLANNLVSYGSCQFPTLGFVVERYRAVENFVSENFWKIVVVHTMNDLKVEFSWKRNRLFDEQACMVLHDTCMENPLATVQNVKSKPKSKWRPLPLDTIEMEKLGSRKLRINAKETMKIAEKLYTQGIISYPRTETNIYPKELNLANLVGLQVENPEWGSFAQRILNDGGPTPRQGKKSDQAHPPIHPTKHVNNLSGNEKKIYELIVRSFLACCSKDAQGHETIVDIDIANEKFTANGLMIIARNYLDVYPYEKWSGKEIHIYEQGQTFTPTSIDIVPGQTSAPSLLTEADLIALMEKHGIGTDATHADHIEKIKTRSYVALADNIHFVPGLLGMGLVEGYDDMGLSFSKPHLRAGLEADLKDVCEGRKRPNDVLSQQIATYRDVYLTVTQEALKIDQALSKRFNENPLDHTQNSNFCSTVMKCDKCRSDMTLRSKKDNQGFFVSCMGFPQCKNAIWFPTSVDKVRVTDESCETCGPTVFKLEFVWKNRSLEHLYPSPFTGCIAGCDSQFLQVLNINKNTSFATQTSTTITSSTSGNSSSSTNQTSATNSHSNNTNQNSTTNSRFNNTNQRNLLSNSNDSSNNNQNRNYSSDSNWFSGTNNTGSVIRNTNASTFNGQNSNDPFNNNQNRNYSSDSNWFSGTNNSGSVSRNTNASISNGQNSNDSFNNNQNRNYTSDSNWFSGTNNSGSVNRNTNTSTFNGQNSNRSTNNVNLPSNSHNDDNHVVCNCGEPAILLTVRKASPNMGRQFYKCQKPKESGGCNFFLWANSEESDSNNFNSNSNNTNNFQNNSNNSWGNPQPATTSSWNTNTQNNRNNYQNSSFDNQDSEVPNCQCNVPSKKITVQKEGPNKGRMFYGCPNGMSNRCSFFQWANDPPSADASTSSFPNFTGSTRGRGRGSTRGAGRGSRGGGTTASTSGTRGRKRCGNCREEGHTRNKCPRLE